MAIIQGNAKQGSTRGFYPKVINGSLRFNDDDVAYLSWTPTSAGNRKTWTFSCWVKRGDVSNAANEIFGTAAEGDKLAFGDSRIFWFQNGSASSYLSTSALFRDPSAWYHIVFALDTTQATPANRCKLWVNGESVAFDNNTTFPTQNYDGDINNTEANFIGRGHSGDSGTFDGYLANVHFIDGQALTASDFGETKNGVWVAKDYAGTFGTNGFYLTFEDDTQVEAFNTVLYRGNGGIQSVTGTGFAPDLVWIKERNGTDHHRLQDTVRGAGYRLYSSTTSAEGYASGSITSFDSDGFTVGSSLAVNESGNSYVAWGWKAGGSSNTYNIDGTGYATASAAGLDGGTITPTGASINTTYGFSIIGYQGTMADDHFEHGLGVAPDMVIIKNRNRTLGTNWIVQHSSVNISNKLTLNATTGADSSGNIFGSTPTAADSNYVYLGNVNWVNNNVSGENDHIAYCWAEKTGYSKFGSYTGNGSTTGPIIYTTDDGTVGGANGFNPACLIVKRTDTTGNWFIWDNTRDTDGVFNTNIHPNSSVAEAASGSNFVTPSGTGFQLTGTGAETNASGGTYIYAAFADTREAAFWLDQSGNDNDWQPVNLDHNDTVADSPTDNFATWNPLFDEASGHTFADGNLKVTTKTTGYGVSVATIVPTAGKFYAEITPSTIASTLIGIRDVTIFGGNNAFVTQNDSNGLAYFSGGALYGTNVSTDSTGGASYTSGDVIGIAINYDDGEVRWYKNGSIQYTKTGLDLTNMALAVGDANNSSSSTMTANFGQQPFKYDPPA